jgi:hypothetical protein
LKPAIGQFQAAEQRASQAYQSAAKRDTIWSSIRVQ